MANEFLKKKRVPKSKQPFRADIGDPRSVQKPTVPPRPALDSWTKVEKFLSEGYSTLKLEAQLLKEEIEFSSSMVPAQADEEVLTNLQAITAGRLSTVLPMAQPLSVREVARTILKSPQTAQSEIIEDLESVVSWASYQTPPPSVPMPCAPGS